MKEIIDCGDGLIQITSHDPHRIEISVAVDNEGEYKTAEALKLAALIAAAPDLLDACKRMMDAFIHTEGNKRGNQAKTDIIKYNQPHVSGALNRARHAIAKAEGTK